MAETLKTALRPITKYAIGVVILVVLAILFFPAQVGHVGSLLFWVAILIAFLYTAVTIGTLVSQYLEVRELDERIAQLTADKSAATDFGARQEIQKQLDQLRTDRQLLPHQWPGGLF